MKKFEEITGWFSVEDSKTYQYLITNIPEDGTIVEIGCWLGKSSSFLADAKKPNQKIICVDTWEGSASELETNHTLVKTHDIYEIFKDNMGDRDYQAIKKPSVEAAKSFEDNSLDAVFIDAEHTYNAVKADIEAWYPKLKNGGYISGHDYDRNWPEVRRAVNDCFKGRLVKEGMFGCCWVVKK